MKRHSEVIYTSTTPFNLTGQRKSSFNFTRDVQLVDYSFTDDEDCDVDPKVKNSWRNLQTSLAQLGSPIPHLKVRATQKCAERSFSRDIGTRLSLKLREEQKAEKLRKDRLISQVTSDIITSVHVCEAEAPRKRRRLDFNFFTKRISLRRAHKEQSRRSKNIKSKISDRIIGILQK